MEITEYHITEDMKPYEYPDRWKWMSALSYIGMEWNACQLRRSGYRGDAGEYYRQFRFVMNDNTRLQLEPGTGTKETPHFVSFAVGGDYYTVSIAGIRICSDNSLPDGRVVLIKGDRCVSFDWCGRVAFDKVADDEICAEVVG